MPQLYCVIFQVHSAAAAALPTRQRDRLGLAAACAGQSEHARPLVQQHRRVAVGPCARSVCDAPQALAERQPAHRRASLPRGGARDSAASHGPRPAAGATAPHAATRRQAAARNTVQHVGNITTCCNPALSRRPRPDATVSTLSGTKRYQAGTKCVPSRYQVGSVRYRAVRLQASALRRRRTSSASSSTRVSHSRSTAAATRPPPRQEIART